MKLDYNNLLRQIDEAITADEPEVTKELAFGIGIGLNLLTSYMRWIGERALELNDEILIGLLLDLHIFAKKEGSEGK